MMMLKLYSNGCWKSENYMLEDFFLEKDIQAPICQREIKPFILSHILIPTVFNSEVLILRGAPWSHN